MHNALKRLPVSQLGEWSDQQGEVQQGRLRFS